MWNGPGTDIGKENKQTLVKLATKFECNLIVYS